jgi:hypothetical protein
MRDGEADLTGQVIASRSSLRDSLLWISGALDLDVFEQPVSGGFFNKLLGLCFVGLNGWTSHSEVCYEKPGSNGSVSRPRTKNP